MLVFEEQQRENWNCTKKKKTCLRNPVTEVPLTGPRVRQTAASDCLKCGIQYLYEYSETPLYKAAERESLISPNLSEKLLVSQRKLLPADL